MSDNNHLNITTKQKLRTFTVFVGFLCCTLLVASCGPTLHWKNSNIAPVSQEHQFAIDHGKCVSVNHHLIPRTPTDRSVSVNVNTEIYNNTAAPGYYPAFENGRVGYPNILAEKSFGQSFQEGQERAQKREQAQLQRDAYNAAVKGCLYEKGWYQVTVEE